MKFTNKGKLANVEFFLVEYNRIVQILIDNLWEMTKLWKFIPKYLEESIKSQTWLSSRMVQAAGSQALAIVRGIRQKQSQRWYKIQQFEKDGQFKKARKLRAYYDQVKISKPDITKKLIPATLDNRFIEIDLDNTTSFDGWLTFGSIADRDSEYKGMKIFIPFKKHKHFNQFYLKYQIIAMVVLFFNCIFIFN